MTRLGEFLAARSINKSDLARKAGLRISRLSQLSLTDSTKLTAMELYKIAKAMDMEGGELLEIVCGEQAKKSKKK